jgi:hypothetical protein
MGREIESKSLKKGGAKLPPFQSAVLHERDTNQSIQLRLISHTKHFHLCREVRLSTTLL